MLCYLQIRDAVAFPVREVVRSLVVAAHSAPLVDTEAEVTLALDPADWEDGTIRSIVQGKEH